MSEMKVVFKKTCSYSQTPGIVSVKQLMIIDENGKNYLAMRLVNERGEAVSAVTVKITEYDEYGKVICVTPIDFEVNGGANAVFVPDQKIELEDDTRDCDVAVMSAVYGAYIYRAVKNKTVVAYNASGPAPTAVAPKRRYADKAGERGIEVKPRRLKIPLLVIFALIASLVAAVFAMYIHMTVFVSTGTSFLHNGVEYEFDGGDRSDGSDIYVVGFHGFRSRIVIPEKIEGHTVKGIRDKAFSGNRSITSISFESELPVGDYAFSDCTSLKSVDFDKIRVFGVGAFSGCTSLDNVVIKPHILGVPQDAFSGCTSLSAVTFEETGVRVALGKNAFAGCTALRVVEFKRQIDYAASGDCDFFAGSVIEDLRLLNFELPARLAKKGLSQLFGGDARLGSVYIDYLASVPSGLATNISSLKRFETKYVEKSEVGDEAFYGCTSLTEFNFPKLVTAIGSRAFSQTALSEFDFSAVEILGSRAFSGCGKLEKVSFLGNTLLDGLGVEMFADCASLKEITLPVAMTTLENGLFKNCASLTDVKVYGDCAIANIGNEAFLGCTSLTGIPALGGNIKQIGARAFKGCIGIVELVVPDTVELVGMGAFADCGNVKSYTAPFIGIADGSGTGYLASVFGANNRFSSTVVPKSLATVTLTRSTRLPDGAFYGLAQLEKAILPDTLLAVGDEAFYGCTAVKQVELPASVRSIGAKAFYGCTGLYSSVLPVGLTDIGNSAFAGCTSFRSFEIPTTVTRIGEFAFSGCTALETITMPFAVDSFVALFGEVPETLATVNIVATSRLPAYAFNGCPNIVEINLPNGLVSVGNFAFSGCSSITSLTVPQTVTAMGTGIIQNMPSLVELSVPFVGGRAATTGTYSYDTSFAYMVGNEYGGYDPAHIRALKKVTLTATEYIPAQAFEGGMYIKQIVLDCDVEQIFTGAFYSCHALYEVFNGSSLDIERGSGYHGGIAADVLAVHDGADAEPLPYVTYDGFGFVTGLDGMRYLVEYDRAAYEYYDENDVPDVVALTVLPSSVPSVDGQPGFRDYRIWQYLFEEAPFKAIEIPSSVVGIGRNAFQNSYMLERVSFGDSSIDRIDRIDDHTFAYCRLLYEINIPKSVKHIGKRAFSDCSRLKRFDIGENVTGIDSGAFEGCNKLFEVYNRSDLSIRAGDYDNGYVAYYAKRVYSRREIESDPNIALPNITVDNVQYMKFDEADDVWYVVDYFGTDGVLKIMPFTYNDEHADKIEIYSSDAFAATGYLVRELQLGNVTEKIDGDKLSQLYNTVKLKITSCGGRFDEITLSDNAFAQLEQLETAEFDVRVREVCSRAFVSSALKTLTFGEVGIVQAAAVLGGNGVALKAGSVDTVSANAFANASISSLEIEQVDVIGDYAFAGSYELTSVKIGEVSSIGNYAFRDCFQLARVELGDRSALLTVGEGAFINSVVKKLEYAGDIAIGNNAFYAISTLAEVSLGSVRTIGIRAFAECSALKNFTASTVEYIGNYAFESSYGLSTFAVGSDIDGIGEYAFLNSGLGKIEFSGDVGSIGMSAFQGSQLREISFGGELRSLGTYAFYATNLRKITLPDSLTAVPAWAFASCAGLREVTLPKSLSSVHSAAFNGSANILLVYNRSGKNVDNVFYDVVAVVTEESKATVEYYETNGMEFAKVAGEWYLINGYDYKNGIHMTPRNVKLRDGTALESFGVAKTVFAGASRVYIGSEVTRVTGHAVMSATSVFYNGTAAKWKDIYEGDVFLDMYYYSDCIHDGAGGVWRFEDDGATPTTADTVFGADDWKEATAPTCSSDGKEAVTCEHCNRRFERVVGKIDHTVTDGKCTQCGMTAERINTKNAESLVASEINNAAMSGFELTADGFTATRVRSAECVVTVKYDGEVAFTVTVGAGDCVTAVFVNGELWRNIYGGGEIRIRIPVSAGDTVSVEYSNAGPSSAGSTVRLTDYVVYYKEQAKEQQDDD